MYPATKFSNILLLLEKQFVRATEKNVFGDTVARIPDISHELSIKIATLLNIYITF